MKQYLPAVFKSVDDSGAFTAVASMPTLDRDGEVIVKGAFLPLPQSIPVCAHHDHSDPVGLARPRYDGDMLLVDGTFGRSARCQEVRQLVQDGILGHVSVGFMNAQREERSGVPHIVRGELLEVSLVSIPSNREAAVLSVRGYQSGKLSELDRWKARIAVLEAELVLLQAERDAKAWRPTEPVDIYAVLADAQSFLAELAQPAAAAAAPRAKAPKAQKREARCLYDVMAARNTKSFDDEPAVEETPPAPAPVRPYTASAYELSRGRLQKDY